MAIDPEEFKRRREKRAARREKQRKFKKILLIAGGALLVVAVVALVAVMIGKGIANRKAEATEDTAPKTVIHLAAAGDLNVTPKLITSGGGEQNYEKTFMDVLPLLADADISVLNLEGNFYGAPYGTDRSAPQSLAKAMAKMGVDLVQVANSYSVYKGMDGLQKTINALRTENIEPVGAYGNSAEAADGKGYTIRTVKGVKIAFIAFTKGMDGMALPAGNEGCVNILYKDYSTDYRKVDTDAINRVLEAAAKEKPDLTVAMLHWGSEYNDNVSKSQEDILKILKAGGVDAVIGTHSHYVQKMALDDGMFVAYSLGDFAGDAERSGSEYSVVLNLEITKNEVTGETTVTGFEYTPIFTVTEAEKPVRVLRIREAMAAFDMGYIDKVSQETYDAMSYALQRIEARIHG